MRAIWSAVSILAVAHLLALAGFVGWLVATGRLDADRVERVRSMLAETIADEQARLVLEAEVVAAATGDVEADVYVIPVSASAMVEERLALEDAGSDSLRRSKAEIDALRSALAQERVVIDGEREGFLRERDVFEKMRAEIDELEGDEQFRKALGVLQGMKPEDASAVIMELINGGGLLAIEGGADGMTQAVAYLDQMSSRARTKIMTEIKDTDVGLAAELLERLRTHGLESRAAEETEVDPG